MGHGAIDTAGRTSSTCAILTSRYPPATRCSHASRHRGRSRSELDTQARLAAEFEPYPARAGPLAIEFEIGQQGLTNVLAQVIERGCRRGRSHSVPPTIKPQRLDGNTIPAPMVAHQASHGRKREMRP